MATNRWVLARQMRPVKPPPEGHVLVGYVDDDGQLRQLHIPEETAHIARERGWMVFTDFEESVNEPADSEDAA